MLKTDIHSHINFLNELCSELHDWHNDLPINSDTHVYLLSLISPTVYKEDICTRTAVTPHERHTATFDKWQMDEVMKI